MVEVGGGRLVFIAGQTALDRDGNLVGAKNLEAQADQVFRNLGYALTASGCTARDLVKLNVFVRDMAGLPHYRKARGEPPRVQPSKKKVPLNASVDRPRTRSQARKAS